MVESPLKVRHLEELLKRSNGNNKSKKNRGEALYRFEKKSFNRVRCSNVLS